MAMHGWHRLPLLLRLFVISVALNYPWEMGQAFLYVGMDYSAATWWHCFVASLGDGVLVGLIYFSGRMAMGRNDWFARPGLKPYAIMVTSGLLIGVLLEWVAVHRLARWTYTEAMPLIPVLDVGWVPVLQMLVLPPLIFSLLAKTVRSRAE
ncbi:hypothetical protein [Rhodoferax sp.]|jgi:hypothetical protein|uniref:hypothetical protein n=1 Tax=Rhodoferax sp. TaxID=50421 RepID=UPI0027301E0D|nr:hypothetical protein [Rhodoferax sp.]